MMLFCLAQIVCFAVINWCEKWPRERESGGPRTHSHALGERARESEEVAPLGGAAEQVFELSRRCFGAGAVPPPSERDGSCAVCSTGSGRRSSAGPTAFRGFRMRHSSHNAQRESHAAIRRRPHEKERALKEREGDTADADGRVERTIRRL